MGVITKTWSNVTSLNYWVVRDYYRLVKSVNALEPQIQRLTDEQVCGFKRVGIYQGFSFLSHVVEVFKNFFCVFV